MPQRGVIILGSSNSQGETFQIVQYLNAQLQFDFVDLNDYQIGFFDYDFKNQGDDFLPLMRRIVADYDTIIFATPVYWYTMSATMKTFFDRISDCLKIEKETGRKLRGKQMAALCCGASEKVYEGFFIPFRLSADYLGMTYLGDVHTQILPDGIPATVQEDLDTFAQKINTSLTN